MTMRYMSSSLSYEGPWGPGLGAQDAAIALVARDEPGIVLLIGSGPADEARQHNGGAPDHFNGRWSKLIYCRRI